MKACIHPEGDVHTPYGATEALPVASIAASEVLGDCPDVRNARDTSTPTADVAAKMGLSPSVVNGNRCRDASRGRRVRRPPLRRPRGEVIRIVDGPIRTDRQPKNCRPAKSASLSSRARK